MVKAVHLDLEGFTVDNNLLTPSFKLKRPQLQVGGVCFVASLLCAGCIGLLCYVLLV